MSCKNRYKGILKVGSGLVLPALFTGALLLTACGRSSETSAVIAQVGAATLTADDLRDLVPDVVLNSANQSDLIEFVNQWMRSELLFQAAETMGYGKDPRVDRRVRQARRDILIDVYLEDEFDLRPFISDEEISSYYQNNLDTFLRLEEEVKATVLWFEENTHAETARQALESGSSIEEVIADSASGVVASNIEMQYLSQVELGNYLGEAVFGVRTGTLSRPIQIDDGYILVRMDDRKEAGTTRSLQEVYDEIVMRLTSDLWEMKLDELLSRLLDQADASINIEAGLDALGRRELP